MDKRFRACVAIIDGDKILLVKGNPSKFVSKHWMLPGGGLVAYESVTQGAAREAREETGFHVAIEKLLYIRHCHSLFYKTTAVEFYFLARIIDGKLELADPDGDITQAKWLSIAGIADADLKPESLRDVLPQDFADGFARNPRDLGWGEY